MSFDVFQVVISSLIEIRKFRCCLVFQERRNSGIFQILVICQMLHDSLSALSMDEEKQRAAFYIVRALDRFKLEADPERALDFFVDARAAFSNLDKVIAVCLSDFRIMRLNFSSFIDVKIQNDF